MNLRGKTVWLTGASSGIGAALAPALAAKGADLILSARREDELRRVADAVGGARIEPIDLADTAQLAPRARQILERSGGIDLVIHNAGISQRSFVRDTSIEVYERLMRVNYLGPVALTTTILPSLVERRGQIVVVSSVVGRFGSPLRSGYSGSKHALHGFFDSLRAEHARDGLKVTIICPGFVSTDISKNALTGDGRPLGTLDSRTARGLSAEVCAAKMIRAIERETEEAHIGGSEAHAVLLKRLFPRLFSWMLARAKVT